MDPALIAARAAAVIALVQIAKSFGLPTNYAAVVAGVIGAALYVAGEAWPALNPMLLGLAAAGIYTLASEIGGGNSKPFLENDAATRAAIRGDS